MTRSPSSTPSTSNHKAAATYVRRSSRAVKKTVFLNPSYASPAALAAPSPATKKKTAAKSKKKIAPAAPSPATKKKTAANQEETEDKEDDNQEEEVDEEQEQEEFFDRSMLTDLWTNIRQERVPTRVLEGKKCRPGRHRDVTIKGARGLLCYLHTFKEWPHTKDTMEKIRARKAPEDMARFNESLNSLFFYRGFTVSCGHWWTNFKRKARVHGVWAPSVKCMGDQDPESVYAGYVVLFSEAGLLPYDYT